MNETNDDVRRKHTITAADFSFRSRDLVSAINYFGKCGKATTYYYMKELNDEPSFTNFPLIVEDLVVMKGKDRCIRKVKI